MKPSVIDLFAGVGGLSLGFEKQGFEVLIANEYDKSIAAAYIENHKNTKMIVGDITSLDLKEVFGSYTGKIDVVIGGPPCQGFSQKGQRKTIHDERNFLFKYYVAVVELVKPKYFVMENVPNLLTAEGGYFFKEIEELFNKMGYSLEHGVLNASDYGVPQNRRRAIIIGKLNGVAPKLPEPQNEKVTIWDAISDLAYLQSGEGTDKQEYRNAPESDYQILNLSAALYAHLSLKRVFFSAYLPVNADKRLPNAGVQLNREHRLYQADWLMRFYKFDATELIDEAHPFLDPELDPKANWALSNLDIFPVEVNTTNLETLLRVPGIGPRGARNIIRARRSTCLREPELRKLGIAFKRARYFITCAGKYQGCDAEFNPNALRAKLAAPINGGKHGSRSAKVAPGQMSIFDLQPQAKTEAQPAFSTRLNLPNAQSGKIETSTVSSLPGWGA